MTLKREAFDRWADIFFVDFVWTEEENHPSWLALTENGKKELRSLLPSVLKPGQSVTFHTPLPEGSIDLKFTEPVPEDFPGTQIPRNPSGE